MQIGLGLLEDDRAGPVAARSAGILKAVEPFAVHVAIEVVAWLDARVHLQRGRHRNCRTAAFGGCARRSRCRLLAARSKQRYGDESDRDAERMNAPPSVPRRRILAPAPARIRRPDEQLQPDKFLISCFANSVPMPASSCLKYTKTSLQPAVLLANHLRPALDVRRLVALVAQAEVCIAGGDFHRRGEIFAIGDTQREALGLQPAEDVRLHPRLVAELERGARAPAAASPGSRRALRGSCAGTAAVWNRIAPSFGPSVLATSRKYFTSSAQSLSRFWCVIRCGALSVSLNCSGTCALQPSRSFAFGMR